MTKQVFEHLLILKDKFYNVEESMHLSWLYQSISKVYFSICFLFGLFCRSLGPLSYLRIWHDHSGSNGSASWFLKYLIVRDLQTMIKSHFLCQQWFAVEKDDGLVSSIVFFLSTVLSLDLD